MPALSNTFLAALASIKSVLIPLPEFNISLGLRASAQTAEGFSK